MTLNVGAPRCRSWSGRRMRWTTSTVATTSRTSATNTIVVVRGEMPRRARSSSGSVGPSAVGMTAREPRERRRPQPTSSIGVSTVPVRPPGPRLLLAVLLVAFAAAPAHAQSWTALGQRGEGVLRFPQAVAVAPDGTIYVGDQFSHVVQAFAPDGTFLREWGVAGSEDGQLQAIGGIAVDASGNVYVADSANRVERFTSAGTFLGSFGRSWTDVGAFEFGSGSGNSSGAGGGLAIAGEQLFVADTRNDRVQRFGLDGSAPFAFGSSGGGPGQLSKP